MTFAEKRQDMVLAQAVEIDVLDDAIAVLDREQSAVEDLVDIRVMPLMRNLSAFSTRLGVFEALAAWIFSELGKKLPDQRLHYWRLRLLPGSQS